MFAKFKLNKSGSYKINTCLALPGVVLLCTLLYNCSILSTTGGPNSGFVELFDGESLSGWEGDTDYWRVKNGVIIGEVTPETILDQNTFLIWQGGMVGDFHLKVVYRISKNGNSGINYRSEIVDGDPLEFIGGVPYALKGYQGDIDGKNNYTGMNYEERKRTTIAKIGESVVLPEVDSMDLDYYIRSNTWTPRLIKDTLGSPDSLVYNIVNPDWHEYEIIAIDNHLQHFVDGKLLSEVIDNDDINRKYEGLLGVQVHVGPPMMVEFRSIKLKHITQ